MLLWDKDLRKLFLAIVCKYFAVFMRERVGNLSAMREMRHFRRECPVSSDPGREKPLVALISMYSMRKHYMQGKFFCYPY
jgi:hypothetical protein